MAVYPCDATGHRYPQPQRSLYLTRANGSGAQTRKMRLCPTHAAEHLAELNAYWQLVEEDTQSETMCFRCGNPRGPALFAKIYMGGDVPTQFAADLCEPHGAEALARLGWDRAKGL